VFRHHQGSDAAWHTYGKPTGARVLLIHPEPAVLHVVRGNFAQHGLRVEGAATGREALTGYPHSRPDVILLDLDLPDMDGCDVIRQVREYTSTPIIVFSGRGQEREKVRVRDLGADDYLAKPFGVDELLARVRVALRRSARLTSGSAAIFRVGDLEVDLERRRVAVGGEEVHLTPIEYASLRVFIAHPDAVLTDRRLLRWVWGDQYGAGDH